MCREMYRQNMIKMCAIRRQQRQQQNCLSSGCESLREKDAGIGSSTFRNLQSSIKKEKEFMDTTSSKFQQTHRSQFSGKVKEIVR